MTSPPRRSQKEPPPIPDLEKELVELCLEQVKVDEAQREVCPPGPNPDEREKTPSAASEPLPQNPPEPSPRG